MQGRGGGKKRGKLEGREEKRKQKRELFGILVWGTTGRSDDGSDCDNIWMTVFHLLCFHLVLKTLVIYFRLFFLSPCDVNSHY